MITPLNVCEMVPCTESMWHLKGSYTSMFDTKYVPELKTNMDQEYTKLEY